MPNRCYICDREGCKFLVNKTYHICFHHYHELLKYLTIITEPTPSDLTHFIEHYHEIEYTEQERKLDRLLEQCIDYAW